MSLGTDLVRDSKLITQVLSDDICVHTLYESDPNSRKRAVPRLEYWQRQRLIGRGSYGSVRLERCVKGQMNVDVRAVKQLSTARLPHQQPLDYARELEAIAKFSQAKYERCFVRAFGWYEDADSLFIAMEYLSHGDLHHYLQESTPLPESDAGEITFQILEGLSYMHENQFAHRDLKPANILLKSKPPDVWVKIGDFGLSKRVEDQLGLTNTLKGTMGFIAPELHGFLPRSDDYAPDMWALGEIAFQMFTKKPAFRHLGLLSKYVHDSDLFPVDDLRAQKASYWAVEFIRSTMVATPGDRLTAERGLNHPWINNFAPEAPTPELPMLQRRSTDRRRSTDVDEVAEEFGAWTAFSASEVSVAQTTRTNPPEQDTVTQYIKELGNYPSVPMDSQEATTDAPPSTVVPRKAVPSGQVPNPLYERGIEAQSLSTPSTPEKRPNHEAPRSISPGSRKSTKLPSQQTDVHRPVANHYSENSLQIQGAPYKSSSPAEKEVPARRDLKSWWKGLAQPQSKETIADTLAKLPDEKGGNREQASAPTVKVFGTELFRLMLLSKHLPWLTSPIVVAYPGDTADSVYGWIPTVVARCCHLIRTQGANVAGIFTLGSSFEARAQIKDIFSKPPNYGSDLDWQLQRFTIHDAANTLEDYLDLLPEPLIPQRLYDGFLGVLQSDARVFSRVQEYRRLIRLLPNESRWLLVYLLDFFAVIAVQGDNGMTAKRLAGKFADAILMHDRDRFHHQDPKEVVVEFLITHQDQFSIPFMLNVEAQRVRRA